MTTRMTTKTVAGSARSSRRRQQAVPHVRTTQRRTLAIWAVGLAVVVAVGTAMLFSARPTQSTGAGPAPDFTLTSTTGATVRLADYRGKDVVLYFNEGVGCNACFYQMTDIEKHAADFANAGVTVLPVVMNPADRTRTEMTRFDLRTPYLIDSDGAVSRAYGTLGKGMHAGLPGHSFVLIDKAGVQRWYGEYPTMHLPSADLLGQVRKHLTS